MVIIDLIAIIVVGVIAFIWWKNNKNPLKSMKVEATGHGQHGTARWATHDELEDTFTKIEYRPDLWRQGEQLPTAQGIVVHCETLSEARHSTMGETIVEEQAKEEKESFLDRFIQKRFGGGEKVPDKDPLYCYVDNDDVHMLLIGASGIGKTAFFLYPNIEYAFAAGMSFLTTDTKGDLYRYTGTIGEKYYGYNIRVIDLRNPMESSGFNMLYLVNKYYALYKRTGDLAHQSKAEKYAKIISKTIIENGLDISQMGQNTYFYDSAEGIVTATLLLIAEYCSEGEKHVVSCFKLIQDLLSPSNVEGRNQYQVLIDLLPEGNRAKWFAATALQNAQDTMQSVMSTAMSKMLSFLDSELEQILCFKNDIDAERFCKEKTALYIVLPEEDTTKHFFAGLIIQSMYREILLVADSMGGSLENRVMFYCDELGTMPKIDGLEAMFSAARSRKVSMVAIIQSLAQFEEKYGKEGAEIIADNCQLTLFGGFAPNSKTAETLSQNLGKQTIESGSVTYGGEKRFIEKAQSRTINMIERSLMTTDELKNMPKGSFILQKTGCHPFKMKLKLFLKWGITFEGKYKVQKKELKHAVYADKMRLIEDVVASNPKFIEEG